MWVLLDLHREGPVMCVLLLLDVLLLLHAVHVVHYHLLRGDLLRVHRLLRWVLDLLEVDFLVLNCGCPAGLALGKVVHSWVLAFRCSADGNGRFGTTLSHLRLGGALHGQTLRVPAQLVHFLLMLARSDCRCIVCSAMASSLADL